MKEKKIVVIGSYIVALVMDTERIPNVGETLKGSNYRSAYGGKGSNQAVQAARLGSKVEFLTKIGNDSHGDDFVKLCRQEGISKQYIFRDPHQPTATGFIICSQTGQNIITIDVAALNNITMQEVDAVLNNVSAGDVILLQLEIPIEIALYAAKSAKQMGAIVILNPAPAVNLCEHDLSAIDYLTPNETEVRICAGLEVHDPQREEIIAKKLLAQGCRNIIVTLGEQGALLCNDRQSTLFEPYKLTKAIDSTGAGDAFNAALASKICSGSFAAGAIAYANAVAALACTKPDTIPSYGTTAEVEAFIQGYRS